MVLIAGEVDERDVLVDQIRHVRAALLQQIENHLHDNSRRVRGWPSLLISVEQVTFYLDHGFKVVT